MGLECTHMSSQITSQGLLTHLPILNLNPDSAKLLNLTQSNIFLLDSLVIWIFPTNASITLLTKPNTKHITQSHGQFTIIWHKIIQQLCRIPQILPNILINPFTPESDQCKNSPAASQEIWHHTVWRTWLFIAYSDERWLYYKFSLQHSYKGWENTLFELRSERVNTIQPFVIVRRSLGIPTGVQDGVALISVCTC